MNLIDINYNEDIFKNVRSNLDFKHEINKSNAVFLSQPGQITFTRKFRQVLEYGQFFLSYIMAFYFLLIIYLMRPPPQKYSILLEWTNRVYNINNAWILSAMKQWIIRLFSFF